MNTRGEAGKLGPEDGRLSSKLCGVMGDASDSDRGGNPRLPLPADDADDAGDAAATTPRSCCWLSLRCCCCCCCPHTCKPRREAEAEGMVEARLRVLCPSAAGGGGDPSGSGRSGGFGLFGPRMRRSAAYLQSSLRSRHRWHDGCSPEHCVTTEPLVRKESS